MLSFKPTFSLSSFTFIKRLFSSSSLSAIRVVSSAIPGPLSKRKRRLDSLEAAQGAPRDPSRESRGERSPWLPLETRPDSPEEPGMQPRHFQFSLSCIGERNGNPLQCSCLENPRDRGYNYIYEQNYLRSQLPGSEADDQTSGGQSSVCGALFTRLLHYAGGGKQRADTYCSYITASGV